MTCQETFCAVCNPELEIPEDLILSPVTTQCEWELWGIDDWIQTFNSDTPYHEL